MKKQWFRMDNAALIFPAIMRRNWNNVFRLSATLTEKIDIVVLDRALEDMAKRFPSYFVCLHKGLFWYYLEEMKQNIKAKRDFAYPLTYMSVFQMKRSLVRVFYFDNRIAVEFFHSVTDGNGGCIFLQNLVARYLSVKYGIAYESGGNLVSFEDIPSEEEVRDGFQIATGKFPYTPSEPNVYKLTGTPEYDGFRHLITGILPTDTLLKTAHSYGVTVTVFLASVMAEAVAKIQAYEIPEKHLRPVNITIPVNLRKVFRLSTFRNFALTLNLGFDPRTGEYSLSDICKQIAAQLSCECVPQKMSARIAANVIPQKNPLLRICPLPLKSFVMRLVYAVRGESKGCLNISNLGKVEMPESMRRYIERFEFIIGVQYSYPNNCSVISYEGKTYINMIRSIRESELERLFFSRLVELGVPVEIESNKMR